MLVGCGGQQVQGYVEALSGGMPLSLVLPALLSRGCVGSVRSWRGW